METVRRLYGVFKIRIGLAIMLSALAGLAVTPGAPVDGWKIAVLALATLASSAAAGAFNQLSERDLDARMRRTQRRPFVDGTYTAGVGWYLGILLLLAGAVAVAGLVFNPWVAVHLFLGAFFYGVVYTVWLKRRSTANIVVGGLSGSFAVLAGAAAVDPTPGTIPLILAAVLFLWTPPHFWSLAAALREDYARAGVPMLPVVIGMPGAARVILAHTLVLVSVSLLPAYYGYGWFYFCAAALGGILFIVGALRFVLQPTERRAMEAFKASLLQLTLVLIGAMIEGAGLIG